MFFTFIITKAIGTHEQIEPTIGNTLISKNDFFMMCTDGLSDYIEKKEIEKIIKNTKFETIADRLIKTAKENCSCDNITCVIIKVKNI
jgi:protein phosphatase